MDGKLAGSAAAAGGDANSAPTQERLRRS